MTNLQSILASASLLLLLLSTTTHAKHSQSRTLELPPSVYFEQKADAQQVLLIQSTSNGIASHSTQDTCGTTTYYETSGVVLGVNRTIDPTSTAIGAVVDGLVMQECDSFEFITYQLEKSADATCVGPSDPGRKDEGWCGHVYFIEGMDGVDGPLALAAGSRSFEEVDGSVCDLAMAKNCPEGAGDMVNGRSDGIVSGSDGAVELDGGVDAAETANGVGILSVGCSFVMAALFSIAASFGI